MSDDDLRRWKRRDEYTGDEHLAAVQAHRRGEPAPQFETDEYREARAKALADAGLEPEGEKGGAPKALEDMTPDDHFKRMRRS